MNKEFVVNVGLPEAELYFDIYDNEELDEIILSTFLGGELIEKIGQYHNNDFKNLFEEYDTYVDSCYLRKIVYKHDKDGMKFDIVIDGDDCAHASLKYTATQLDSINAKKIALIESVLEWDEESENQDLVKLFKQ